LDGKAQKSVIKRLLCLRNHLYMAGTCLTRRILTRQ